MPKVIISVTSCLIVLTNIGELELLEKLYGEVLITQDVADEFGLALPIWIKIQSPTNLTVQKTLQLQLDKGESSAIALALEIPTSTLILDDYKARRVAEKLGISITGTLGVIVKAKFRGVISSIKPLLAKLKTTDFRLSEELETEVLNQANE